MMHATRSVAATLLAAALLFACGKDSHPVKACASDPECPSGAYCVGGACVAGLLPEAHIQIAGVAGQLTSHRSVVFDGSGSVDPNPQHRLTSYSWSLRQASAAGCDPTRKAGSDARLETMFPCAGDYHVELKVANSLGLESALSQAIAVSPSANAPVVDGVSPDLVLAHRCGGSPVRCEAVGEGGATSFQLDVRAHDVEDGSALAYRWEVDAPPGAGASAVTFDPAPTAQSPRITIASAGGAVAGEWVVRALVTDGDQLTSAGAVHVSVANAQPTLALAGGDAAVAFDHVFADHVYRVTGTVHLVAGDPDGDVLAAPVTQLVESVVTGCHFDVASTVPTTDGFDVAIGMTCDGAAALSPTVAGTTYGAQVARTLELTVADGQGATASLSVPFLVNDRPPVFPSATVTTTHGVGSCLFRTGWCFVAQGTAPAPVDPDGDEVAVTAVSRGSDATTSWSSSGASFTLATDGAYPLAFRTAGGLHPVAASATVADPWRTTALPFQLAIPNSAPVVTSQALRPVAGYDGVQYVVDGVAATVTDPDGDPVTLASSTGDCAATLAAGALQAACTSPYDWRSGPPALGTFVSAPRWVRGAMGDPWAPTTFAVPVAAVAPSAPSVASTRAVDVGCAKSCEPGLPCEWVPKGGCFDKGFAPTVTSNVPVQVHAWVAGGASAYLQCFAGQCTGTLPIQLCGPLTVNVEFTDGAQGGNGLVTVDKAACQ